MPFDMPDKLNRALPVLDCRACGVCCLHMGYPAFNFPVAEQLGEIPLANSDSIETVAERDRARWNNLPEDLKVGLREAIEDYRKPAAKELDGPCTWWNPETKLCRHHEHRPQVCRDFEVGSPGCLEWRRAYQVGET